MGGVRGLRMISHAHSQSLLRIQRITPRFVVRLQNDVTGNCNDADNRRSSQSKWAATSSDRLRVPSTTMNPSNFASSFAPYVSLDASRIWIQRTSDIPSTHRPLPQTTPPIHITRPALGYQMPGSRVTTSSNLNPTNLAASLPSAPLLVVVVVVVAKVHSAKRIVR